MIFILNGLKAEKPGKLVIHQRVGMNGFGSECRHRCFLSMTDEVVKWHLLGHDNAGKDFVMGIYPMLLDETCFFLAADFDKSNWETDARAFFNICKSLNIPAAIERSR